jgi:hypothetical protein
LKYQITEHLGRKIKAKLLINAPDPDPEQALRMSARPPFKMPPEAYKWRFIDDGLGGGALIDPKDEDHCLRADPRPEEEDEEEE